MHFSNFLKKFFENFRKFSGRGGGLRSWTPQKADPQKCSPEPTSWLRHCPKRLALKEMAYVITP